MSTASALLALAFLAQVFLTLAVYFLMAQRRFGAGRRGEVKLKDYLLVQNEPPHLARITRNVANQFELPVIFYGLVLLILLLGGATLFDAVVAWLFVASRIAHAAVHIRTEDVVRRARLFQVGFGLVVLLALHPLYLVIVNLG